MASLSRPRLSQKESGAYFTPESIASALVKWAVRKHGDRLIDPSCGNGGFLTHHRNSVGIEQDSQSAHEAMERAPWALVHEGDFFTWAKETSERFECAAGNPPFIRYQSFKGDQRKEALAHCASHGAYFSGLTSSWAPFLVSTATLLKKGGRMAFVVPAEIGHAPYSAPLVDFLVRSFGQVRVVAVREKLFPQLSEDCWLLFADHYGRSTNAIEFSVLDRFTPDHGLTADSVAVDVEEWRTIWNCRLRPFLMSTEARQVYKAASRDSNSKRFSDFASIGIGYVSGGNDFFHLRPSVARKLRIEPRFLKPSVRNARSLPTATITADTIASWVNNDDAMLLLRIGRGEEISPSVKRYLDGAEGRSTSLGYKCRNREPWYSVPDVQEPEYILQYMSGRSAALVRNEAGVTCTNSVHAVRIRDRTLAKKLIPNWNSDFVRLSCEIEGHALGGGMLKLEPREAGNILFPSASVLGATANDVLSEAIQTLQKWRHYST